VCILFSCQGELAAYTFFMKQLAGFLLVCLTLSFAPQLSAQLFGPGVIRTGPSVTDRTIEINFPARPGAQAATVLITPPAQPQLITPMQIGPRNFRQPRFFGQQAGQFARPMYVQPTAGSVIIITPPRINAAYPARQLFGR